MKRILKSLIALAMLFVLPMLGHTTTFQGTCYPSGLSTDTNGDATDTDSYTSRTGVTNGDVFVKGILESYTGIMQKKDIWLAPEIASATAYKILNISSATIMASATTWTLANTDYTNVITPRNLVFVSSCATTNSAQAMSLSALVTGIDARGNSTTETITFSTTTGTGNIAWSSVTSIKVTATKVGTGADTNISIDVGSGVKIGLSNSCVASGDMLKVLENGAISTTYTLNTTYSTITFASAPNSTQHYQVLYKVRTR
jgi:hypothetical protein